ncbi:SMP-30/gluconolactonase/LRE family protein [Mucilaginibacter sp.]|uniref:SMP-30/gluconolactonase/LRE family protein n=1 Tax=Mucilaginibacter sp. TaxID=1882438 RepID=UPI002631E28F|nr:SMP-30/gluconolactonase/LRE family protein [Mucilaginibacter sp.]MDB5126600.1 repeat containing protein [Mucilaginibacter sp.]
MKNIFLTGAVIMLLLISCKKDLGISADGLKADNKNIALASPDPTFTTVSNYLGNGAEEVLNGPLNIARANLPNDIAIGPDGYIYFTDVGGYTIRKISPDGIVSNFAGSGVIGNCNGPALKAQIGIPQAIVVTNDGIMYMCDVLSSKIRKIENGIVTTLAGSPAQEIGDVDGVGLQARFQGPTGIALGPDGSLYVTDAGNHKIKKVTPAGVVTTIAGSTEGFADGPALLAKFYLPIDLVVLEDGTIVVTDGQDHKIRKISPAGVVSTFVGGVEGDADGLGTSAKISAPTGITLAPNGTIYFSDSHNHKIRKISPSGLVTTVAGSEQGFLDGPVLQARFTLPQGLVCLNDLIYVCDFGNNRIRKIE